MKEKALVIKTGDVFDIEKQYETRNLSIDLDNIFSNLSDDKKDELSHILEHWVKPNDSKEGTHYVLSDNKEYFEDEVIVGLDNIRDYKISNQIKLDE